MSARFGRLRRARRAVQATVFAVAVAAPFLDLFRLDVPSRSLVFLGQHLYLSHFWVLLLFLLLLVYGFVALNLIFGRVFCGWVCPQTFISEIAEGVAARLLGHRSPLAGRADPARLRGARRLAFHLAAAAASLAGGFVLAAYLVPPATLVAVLGRAAPGADRAVWLLYLSLALGLYLNATVVRHRICAVCPLGAAQFILRGERTLQPALNPARAAACVDCGACARACPMGLDPRDPDVRHCLNCGECLVACGLVAERRRTPSLLGWFHGRPAGGAANAEGAAAGAAGAANAEGVAAGGAVPEGVGAGGVSRARLAFLGTVFLLLFSFFTYGLVTRARVGLAVVRDPRHPLTAAPGGRVAGQFLVLVRNQGERPGAFTLSLSGLPRGWEAVFSAGPVRLDPGRQARLGLRVLPPGPRTPPGVYAFRVRAAERRDPRWAATSDATFFLPPRVASAAGR